MKTSWMQGEAAGCIHLPFQDLTKLVTGFCHHSVLGSDASFPLNRNRESREGKRERREGGKKREQDFFFFQSGLS